MKENNKYQRWYNQLIDRARNRVINGYSEEHHVIPRSLGGNDEASNLVKLTAREHIIAHMLLPRFVKNNDKLWYALWCMVNTNGIRVNSRLYEVARVEGHQKLTQDSTWIKNVQLAADLRKLNPVWRENKKIANQKLAQDPVWRKKNTEKNKKQAQDPAYRAKLKEAWVKRKERQAQDPAYATKKIAYTKAGWLTRQKKRASSFPEAL